MHAVHNEANAILEGSYNNPHRAQITTARKGHRPLNATERAALPYSANSCSSSEG